MCFAIAPGQYKNYQGERNNKRYEKDGTTVKSSLNQVTAFTESGYGMFRTLQVLGKTGNAVSMGLKEYQMPDMAAKVDKICGNLNTAANWTLIPHLPKVTQNAYNAVWGEKKGQSVSEKRDRLKVVHDLADCGAAWSYTGLMVTGDVGLKHIGDGFSLVSDMTDLECAREDYCYSKKLLEQVKQEDPNNEDMKTLFRDTTRYNMLKILKAVCCIVSTIFGLLLLGFGYPILPPAVSLALGLISTITAIAISLYEATAEYKMINFSEVRKPVLA